MVKITCSSCQKPLSIDETKLPMREVSFPCPLCKVKLTLDRRNLAAGAGLARTPQPQVPASVPSSAPEPGGSGEGSKETADDEERFTQPALLVGDDGPELRQALRSIGFRPVHSPSGSEARDYYLREFPGVVLLAPQQLGPPPIQDLAALTSVGPVDRRKGLFILVAENLKTLDGNAAFLYQVNLVVSRKDLGSFDRIFREAETAHERLYLQMNLILSHVS